MAEDVTRRAEGTTAKEALSKLPERMADPESPMRVSLMAVSEPTCREAGPGRWVAERLYQPLELAPRTRDS